MKKYVFLSFRFCVFLSCLIGWVFCFFCTHTYAWDLLEQAFEQSASHNQIVDIGQTKNAVGNEVFHESVGASWKKWEWFKTERKPGLLVNITRLLMRIAIVIAIPMIIINAIILVLSATGRIGWDLAKVVKQTIFILVWIAIVLSAIGIIYLVQSGTTGTILKIFQGR